MTLEQIADANGKTLFEFFQQTYLWRWGLPPHTGTVTQDIHRYKTWGTVPEHCEDYLRSFETPTPSALTCPN
jgi:hypothetical protein